MDAYFGRVPNFEPKVQKASTRRQRVVPSSRVRSRSRSRSRPRARSRSGSHSKAATRPKNHAPSVRYISNPVVSKTDWKKAEAFVKEVDKLPIYLIAAHSCICSKDATCYDEKHPFSFNLPENAYIVNMVQAGDYACIVDSTIHLYVNYIRKFLYIHDTDDVQLSDAIGKSEFGFFSGLQRAVGPSEHPNILYTFNEKGKDGQFLSRYHNPYGVYDISDENSTKEYFNDISIIPQDLSRNNWSLKQIIHDVYKATGKRKGVFISTGCLSSCNTRNSGPSMREAGMLMAKADAEYRTHRETLTAEELEKKLIDRPFNMGIQKPHAALDPKLIKEMADEGLYDMKSFADAPLLFNSTNRAAMEGMMRKRFKRPASPRSSSISP